MGSMDFRTEQRQTQTLSPRLQHAVRLLQLSSLEFAQQVHDALGKNPFLEEDGNPDDQSDEGLSPEQAAEAQEAREAQEAAAEAMAAPEGEGPGEGDRDMWQADGLGSGKRADDDETSALDMMAVPTSLAAHLHGQLAVLPLTLRAATPAGSSACTRFSAICISSSVAAGSRSATSIISCRSVRR